jgi:NitT/TauT family transport system ATP-binding protein
VLYPLRIAGVHPRVQAERFDKLVSLVQPTFGFHQRVAELSGGEAQITSLLRALIVEPEVLVCDEPTSALDYQASINLVQRLMEVSAELGITVVFVGHDLDEVLYAGDEVLFLSKRPGRVVGQLRVDLPRPRTMSLQTSERFAALKSEALKLFELCISDSAVSAHSHG